MTLIKDKQPTQRLTDRLKQGFARFGESESALVVCWFDIIKVLAWLAFIWVCISPLMDAIFIYVFSAPTGLYTTKDYDFIEDVYNLWRFIPLIGFGLIIFYAINYSNWKRGD
jgi:hypothetical protein